MNSLGVSPYVNWLYSDLADGLIIFQVSHYYHLFSYIFIIIIISGEKQSGEGGEK